jgi:hypothetical protein
VRWAVPCVAPRGGPAQRAGRSDPTRRSGLAGRAKVIKFPAKSGLPRPKPNQVRAARWTPGPIGILIQDRWDGSSLTSTPLPEGFAASLPEGGEGINPTDYLSTIGSLSYVAVGTQPNIAYSINYLVWFLSRPLAENCKGLQHLISYLAATKTDSLQIHPDKPSGTPPVDCFCDAHWGGGTKSGSTYGVLIRLYGCPVMWVSRRIVTVASSTFQAKYMALGHATCHCLWIRNPLYNIIGTNFPVRIFCNNQSAVKIGCEDVSNKQTHYI